MFGFKGFTLYSGPLTMSLADLTSLLDAQYIEIVYCPICRVIRVANITS